MSPFLSKLVEARIWERLLRERLSEPFLLNIASLFVGLFGSFESKVYMDLVLRQHNAFCLLQAARFAKDNGYGGFTAIEFGVANGAGLFNMAGIAARVTRATGIQIDLAGFDTGAGMPEAVDYRDHPQLYGPGDFPMQDFKGLAAILPPNAHLEIGQISQTVPAFLGKLRPDRPLGYVVIDVDYYSSSASSLEIFSGTANQYLPEVLVYLDDITFAQHNPWQGEYLAVNEFNAAHAMRKICPYNLLRAHRLFKRAIWIDQVYTAHILDHKIQSTPHRLGRMVLGNAALNLKTAG